ncbi:hypothetical protein TREMEDRAFT_66421 [Tremella mesenterica DSM 1558]|uniref:uncharacterized protein n=1 Tax=Tremella mesenterica (strain ATCC 24925 / CBS 8224 / DSM 1558 / NBRC 9311 / NRRL Y-6157 / RJB 2259-6 / UBC 559-6) TaxID=578456 RepID=UPI00032D2ABE|nr:uncharacterized protein TREMEDRAFT_66421 [Tremella mesenterica DSM 1558]EIW65591.1 hypothetical protein TREMEDRAFT_66421 [Tremella mesenterica DSM 1558]
MYLCKLQIRGGCVHEQLAEGLGSLLGKGAQAERYMSIHTIPSSGLERNDLYAGRTIDFPPPPLPRLFGTLSPFALRPIFRTFNPYSGPNVRNGSLIFKTFSPYSGPNVRIQEKVNTTLSS